MSMSGDTPTGYVEFTHEEEEDITSSFIEWFANETKFPPLPSVVNIPFNVVLPPFPKSRYDLDISEPSRKNSLTNEESWVEINTSCLASDNEEQWPLMNESLADDVDDLESVISMHPDRSAVINTGWSVWSCSYCWCMWDYFNYDDENLNFRRIYDMQKTQKELSILSTNLRKVRNLRALLLIVLQSFILRVKSTI